MLLLTLNMNMFNFVIDEVLMIILTLFPLI